MPRATKSSRLPPTLPARTFILDNGGYTLKAGFAPPNSQPDAETLLQCHIIPNTLLRTRDRKTYIASQLNSSVIQWSESLYRRPVEHGQVVSWEAEQSIWEYSFFDETTAAKEVYIAQPEETTLVLAEHGNGLPALGRNADEIVMEEWGFGGYLRTGGAGLNAWNDLHPLFEEYATEEDAVRVQGGGVGLMECLLVVDSGYSGTSITPLYNGRPIQRAVNRLDFGGKHLTNLLKETISVRYFDLHQDTKIVNDIKEDISFVSDDFKADMERAWKGNKRKAQYGVSKDATNGVGQNDGKDVRIDYILPDGINVLRGFARPHDPSTAAARKRKLNSSAPDSEISMTLANERFTIPEILFNPSDLGSKQPGIAGCIMKSLSLLPPLIQATMLSNVLVVGGSAKIPGFVDRVQNELRSRVRSEWAVRVRSQQDPITSTWLGGARLASGHREVVREYGVTREEYLEHGSAWTARKFLFGAAGVR